MLPIPHSLLFGEGFYQDSQVIRIQKSSLPGLTPSLNNTPESLLAALILQAVSVFVEPLTDENDEILTDENDEILQNDSSTTYESLFVSFWKVLFITKGTSEYIRHTFLVEVFASSLIPYEQTIKPDDLE